MLIFVTYDYCAANIVIFDIIRKIIATICQTSNSSSKTRGAAVPCTRIIWASFSGLEEPLLKLLCLAELQHTNCSPISNCRCSKSAIFFSHNINYNINSLLWLRIGTYFLYIYIYIKHNIPEVKMKII